MLQSKIFTKTRFEAPKDEVSKNAELLIRAGFIHKEMAGVYSILPMGLRVLENLKKIVREEINNIGGQELSLTALQSKELWEKTGRWDDKVVDNWFKTKLKNDNELGLGFSHEEPLTNLLKDHIRSYKDLPIFPYQLQTKFRNELRAKSGILRGREFLMKDLYSFSRNEEDHNVFYEKVKGAYKKIFERSGIGEKTHLTFASGGTFAKYSHEFQTETEAGEDHLFIDENKEIAINKEVFNPEVLKMLGLEKNNLVEKKGIEVGNIFNLGTKYSEALGLVYANEKGELKPVIMGCYGIGITRLMGTIAEVWGEKDAMTWPLEVAPFKIHIIDLSLGDESVQKTSQNLYESLVKKGIDVLLDDRDGRAGEKFADADLIGIPLRIVSSKKTLEKGAFEVTDRLSSKVNYETSEEILQKYGK